MKHTPWALAIVAAAAALLLVNLSLADPTGASFTSNSTGSLPTSNPASITNNRSTITTVVLNAVQQDQFWKAYVGNVTGTFTLDDASSNTIYDWSTSSFSGEVYASRNGSLSWSTVACANATIIGAEETALNMSGTQADNIRNTFAYNNHTDTTVAGTTLSGCNSTTLYVSDASQGGANATADFQEFLARDANDNLIYVSIINDNTVGFDGTTYDFQMIVAESDVQSAQTYYFYIELDAV